MIFWIFWTIMATATTAGIIVKVKLYFITQKRFAFVDMSMIDQEYIHDWYNYHIPLRDESKEPDWKDKIIREAVNKLKVKTNLVRSNQRTISVLVSNYVVELWISNSFKYREAYRMFKIKKDIPIEKYSVYHTASWGSCELPALSDRQKQIVQNYKDNYL